ncbi:hypothetical protein [Streptomyces sporangiiformans]|uniref:Uncharacterized protein n=1 Tax=Streptomyces sporangiiformans TaxID=2315329 RepID=A0A505DQM4_9ACTN|nr:hypothetical protein [Streptomyces sporangiiformans]TPQ23527.1 hypothetical protein FGD71_003720 [Streptomyces sporangiiformans]
MAEKPVPLPPNAAPTDAAAWLSSDAERWRALRPGWWAHPFPTVLALALACLAALWLAPENAYLCGDGHCTPDWLATAMGTLVFAVLYRGIRLLPLATAVALPLIAVWVLLDPDSPTTPAIAVAVTACYACLGCLHRLAAARRQRRLGLETAGPARYALPEAAMTLPDDAGQLGCGIVTAVAAVVAFVIAPLGVTPLIGAQGWQWVAVFGTLIGCLSLAYQVRDRRRAAVLRREPVPALRVLVREGGGHNDRRTYVFAADDLEGNRPLLGCYTRLAGSESRAPVHNRLREAVLFGPPHPGGGLVLVSSDGQEAPGLCIEWDSEPARQEYSVDRPERLGPGAAPVSWGPGTGSRLCAVVVEAALIACVVAVLAVWGGAAPLQLRIVLAIFVLANTPVIATQFSWRVTADSTGLWAPGWRQVRHVPWGELDQVRLWERGFNILRSGEGARGIEIYGVVAPAWLNGRFRRRPVALRAVDGIRAMQADAALRPTEESTMESRGRPVGLPLLVINAASALALSVFG